MRNHSVSTSHAQGAAEVLGPHVQQKGSLVDADKTRFDFAHDKPVSDEEVRKVERLVNAES
jgi:alanyl-tRNA synthetase